MALTEYQIAILRLLSERRKRDGVSYIAGGAALNDALKACRRSNDIDIFHDTAFEIKVDTKEEFERRSQWLSSVEHFAAEKGRLLYGRLKY